MGRRDPAALLALSLAVPLLMQVPAVAGAQATEDRLAGTDRYETAVAISQHAFPSGADNVYVARGTDPVVDALAGGALTGGPILLVGPDCAAPSQETRAEASRLTPDRVTALGGESAVCRSQLDMIADAADAETSRLAGSDRYATATTIASHRFPDGAPVVYLARATGPLVDALAGGVLTDGPILLVPGDCGPVPDAVQTSIEQLDPATVTALGGPQAICDDQLREAAASVQATERRLAGPDRYTTATAISRHVFASAAPVVYLARGHDPLVDALAGGVLTDGPILLAPGNCGPLPSATAEEIRRLGPGRIVALGGTVAICAAQLTEATAAAGKQGGQAMRTHERLTSGSHLTAVSSVVSTATRQFVLDMAEPARDGDDWADVFSEVEIFDHAGGHVGQVADEAINKGVWAAARGDRLLVVDNSDPNVQFGDVPPTGDRLRLFTAAGAHVADLDVPNPQQADNRRPILTNDRIYVTDHGDSETSGLDDVLYVFDRNGNPRGQVAQGEPAFVGPKDIHTSSGWFEGLGHVYTAHQNPDQHVRVYDRDGDLLRVRDGYYDVAIGQHRLHLTRQVSDGVTQVDTYTPDGLTLLGSTGPLDGWAEVYATNDDLLYIHLADEGLQAESLLQVGHDGKDARTLIPADAEHGISSVWPTPQYLYVPTVERESFDDRAILIFDRDGNAVGQLDGEDTAWFRPTSSWVYRTASTWESFVVTPDGSSRTALAQSPNSDGVHPPPAPDADIAPVGGEGSYHWMNGSPFGPVPDGHSDALPAPQLLYVRDYSNGWHLDVYRPDGTYVETFPDTRDVAVHHLGDAVIVSDNRGPDAPVAITIWRRTGT